MKIATFPQNTADSVVSAFQIWGLQSTIWAQYDALIEAGQLTHSAQVGLKPWWYLAFGSEYTLTELLAQL